MSIRDRMFLRRLTQAMSLVLLAFVCNTLSFISLEEFWPLTRYPMYAEMIPEVCFPVLSKEYRATGVSGVKHFIAVHSLMDDMDYPKNTGDDVTQGALEGKQEYIDFARQVIKHRIGEDIVDLEVWRVGFGTNFDDISAARQNHQPVTEVWLGTLLPQWDVSTSAIADQGCKSDPPQE